MNLSPIEKKKRQDQYQMIKFYKLSCSLSPAAWEKHVNGTVSRDSKFFEIDQLWEVVNRGSSSNDLPTSNIQRVYIRSTEPTATLPYPVGWVMNHSTGACMICNGNFTLNNRRHHCRSCGDLICASCSSGVKVLPEFRYLGGVRICSICEKGDPDYRESKLLGVWGIRVWQSSKTKDSSGQDIHQAQKVTFREAPSTIEPRYDFDLDDEEGECEDGEEDGSNRPSAARESVDVSCAEAISIEPVESELSPTDQLKEKESSNKTETGTEADTAEDGPGAAGAAGGGAEAEAAGPGSDLSSIREDSSELSDLSQNYDTVLDLNSPTAPSGGASDEQQGQQGPPRGTEGELRDPGDLQKEDLSPAALEANPSQPNGKALRQSRSRSMNLVSTFRRQSMSASSAASASTPGHDDSPATSLQGSASSSGSGEGRGHGQGGLSVTTLLTSEDASAEEASQLKLQAAKDTKVLLGWQIELLPSSSPRPSSSSSSSVSPASVSSSSASPPSEELCKPGYYIVKGLRKNPMRQTEFHLQPCGSDGETLAEEAAGPARWVLLKRSEGKGGRPFTPLRKILANY